MDILLTKIAELLDVEKVDPTKKFRDYDEWDSFTRLSVLAMLDSDYHIQMKFQELEDFENIESFCQKVIG